MHTNRKIEESRMDLVEKKNSRENERGITNIWDKLDRIFRIEGIKGDEDVIKLIKKCINKGYFIK